MSAWQSTRCPVKQAALIRLKMNFVCLSGFDGNYTEGEEESSVHSTKYIVQSTGYRVESNLSGE